MTTVALVGATGLVGSIIFNTLKGSDAVKHIYTFSRKALPGDAKVTPIVSKDATEWTSQYPSGSQLFISALGTTRGNAGGFENQRKIDYDLNLAMAKAARESGSKVYVLISSSGANSKSSMGYLKMKGELEEAVQELGFENVVIVRPGVIVGNRQESRIAEAVLRNVARFAGSVSGGMLKDSWAQDDVVIARAAVRAGLDAVEGKVSDKSRILGQGDIVRLGRTEWKD
ncbi:NAD dependent epimerase dehydratase family [Lecanosticta acicola]|uniref:NAD dependent epimerase dehydratase family n=1 Tax=Lecanosticta acicola TaxID=111012 RepID=A0AAI8Z7P0_9PEZI|nr:NAD dependent epimerase dehydratase family [Lecanosticta acicola]